VHSTNGSIIIVIEQQVAALLSLNAYSSSDVSARPLYIIMRKRAKEAASVRDRRDIGIVFFFFFIFLLLIRVYYHGLGQCSLAAAVFFFFLLRVRVLYYQLLCIYIYDYTGPNTVI